jgi:hypothetical protein
MAKLIHLPRGYLRPDPAVFGIREKDELGQPTAIFEPLIKQGAFSSIEPGSFEDICGLPFEIEKSIANALCAYASALAFAQKPDVFRDELKRFQKALGKLRAKIGNTNTSTLAAVIKELDNSGEDGSLIVDETADGLAKIATALETVMAKCHENGRPQNAADRTVIEQLASIYQRATGKRPTRVGGSDGSNAANNLSPFECFVISVLDHFDSVVLNANAAAPENAKLPLSMIDRLGTIRRVLAGQKPSIF